MGDSAEIVVHGDLDQVPREDGTTGQQNIDNPIGEDSPSRKRPVHGFHGSISGEEVMRADVRVLREGMEALRSEGERGRVWEFKEYQLQYLIAETVHRNDFNQSTDEEPRVCSCG